MDTEITSDMLDDKNMLVMKLLHYFITEKNYNPIILQGVDHEIWLENMDEDYKIVRIVSNNIINEEQFNFDIFKTRRIVKKIKKKTLTLKINTLSIFLDIEKMEDKKLKDITCVYANDEKELKDNFIIKSSFPDMIKKLKWTEKGMQLFIKITNDISEHNIKDNQKVEEIFSPKKPIITYILIGLCICLYLFPIVMGKDMLLINLFSIYKPYILNGEYYRLLTGTFLHANILHLGFNCYALYVIGSQLESFLGKFKYLFVYLFSAICGSLMSMIFLANNVAVGASGAIFGLMGSLVYFGLSYRVYLGNTIKTQIIPLIVTNLFLGFMINGIDNFAHIGGLIGGAMITIALGVKYKTTTFERVNGAIISVIYLAFLTYMAFKFGI